MSDQRRIFQLCCLFLSLLTLGLLGAVSADAQTVLRVDASAPGGGDGSSWASAFNDLVLALDAAVLVPGPVQIWVASDTYLPDSGSGDITRSFVLSGGVKLLGGFAGTETAEGQRDTDLHETILSGDLWGNDFPDWLQRLDNSLNVLVARDLGAPSTVDGFTISGGNADYVGSDLLGGGGIFVERSDLEVRQCLFTENVSGGTLPTVGNFGGAVYAKGSGTVTLDECRFIRNRAMNGGALGALDRDGGAVDFVIRDSIFERNESPSQSGGAILFGGRSLIVEGCTFNDHSAEYGGVIRCTNAEEVVLRDSDFSRNFAAVTAAAVYLDRSSNGTATPAIIERCRFEDNSTHGLLRGGTLKLLNTITHMSHCEILGGYNARVNPNTGFIEGLGTVTVEFGIGHRFINCLVADNFCGALGGVFLASAQAEFVNCSIVDNRGAAIDVLASGIGGFSSSFTVENTILWGNRFGKGINDDLPGTGGEAAQLTVSGSTLAIDYSDAEGWTGTFGGAGNVDVDPMFVPIGTRNYHVIPSSPVVNAGDNAAVPPDLLVDLDGNPRITDANQGGTPQVDMGAYERLGVVLGVDGDPGAHGPLSLTVRREGRAQSIAYRLPRDAHVNLSIFDVRGRRMLAWPQGALTAGEHHLMWNETGTDGRVVASGVYFLRLEADDVMETIRLAVTR